MPFIYTHVLELRSGSLKKNWSAHMNPSNLNPFYGFTLLCVFLNWRKMAKVMFCNAVIQTAIVLFNGMNKILEKKNR